MNHVMGSISEVSNKGALHTGSQLTPIQLEEYFRLRGAQLPSSQTALSSSLQKLLQDSKSPNGGDATGGGAKGGDSKESSVKRDVESVRAVTKPAFDSVLTEDQRIIRNELLSMKYRVDRSPSQGMKRYYTETTSNQIGLGSTTELSSIFNATTQGTAINNRIGLSQKNHRLFIRGWIKFYQAAVPTAGNSPSSTLPPMVRIWVSRDLIPTTIGAVPAMLTTGTDPPGNNDNYFSNLGVALGTRGTLLSCVENPVACLTQHIYHDEMFPKFKSNGMDQAESPYASGSISQQDGTFIHFKFDIPLHGFKSEYLAGGTNPVTNSLNWNIRGDSDPVAQGILYSYNSELIFEDTQIEE